MSIPNLSSVESPAGPSVSVVIPALNEARNLPWVIRRLPNFVDEVVLVDGRSNDHTAEVARTLRPDIVVVTELHPGKGAAIRAGFAKASGEILVILDADGSMDPQEIGWLVSPLQYDFDFVKGSRYVTGGGSDDLTYLRDAGNRALTALTNTVFHCNFSDLCYGYIALRRECIDVLDLTSDGFEIETELVVHAVLAGLRIAEVPSAELRRISGLSNLHAVRDGLRVVRTLALAWASWAAPTGGARPEAVRRVAYRYPQPRYPHAPTDPDTVLHPRAA
jgi:glycosyltransferase involved in cell wall biosynthesis